MQLQRILVALKPWERTLPLAANHARQLLQRGTQLRLVTTVFDAAIASAGERGDTAALAHERRAVTAARIELERLAQTLRGEGRPVTTDAVWGLSAYEAIVAAARDWPADLLIVGAHEPHSALARLTDTDWQLMRHASCPMLLVKSAAFGGYETVVAAVDDWGEGYAVDEAVLTAGRLVARAFDATLSVVPAGDFGRSHARRTCLVVARAPWHAARGGELEAAAEAVLSAAPCDVLLVPSAAVERERAVAQSEVR